MRLKGQARVNSRMNSEYFLSTWMRSRNLSQFNKPHLFLMFIQIDFESQTRAGHPGSAESLGHAESAGGIFSGW